jgi:hypothetical protein
MGRFLAFSGMTFMIPHLLWTVLMAAWYLSILAGLRKFWATLHVERDIAILIPTHTTQHAYNGTLAKPRVQPFTKTDDKQVHCSY